MSRSPAYPRGPYRALIGTCLHRLPLVLATDSPGLAWLCEETTNDAVCLELINSKECQAPGLYVWEGKEVMQYCTWESDQGELGFRGTVRICRPEEVAELYALEVPENLGPDLETEEIGPEGGEQ